MQLRLCFWFVHVNDHKSTLGKQKQNLLRILTLLAIFLKMGCIINTSKPSILYKFSTRKPYFTSKIFALPSPTPNQCESVSTGTTTTFPKSDAYAVNFETLGACKLGISRYPDFEYNARGGKGTGIAEKSENSSSSDEVLVSFDMETLYIPPLTSTTTKFLGLPMPPGLKIDIVPELFQGAIDRDSGKVALEFIAKFWFSVENLYKAPPLLVKTVLTSEESNGVILSGRGQRLNKEGRCRLVGVATVEPIDDLFMNTFLGLPTECLANLNASISFSEFSP